MAHCIFCNGPLDRHTKPEHVLLNALGGRKTTTQVICSQCNNSFGNGIDKALAGQLEVIRNLFQMTSGTGSPAPMLRKVQAGEDVLNVHGDGTLIPLGKPFTYEKLADGSYKVEIRATSLEEINNLIPNIAGALRIPEAEIRKQMPFAKARVVERRPGIIHFPISIGDADAIRSAAKACLVLWALKAGNAELHRQEYKATREFVVAGDASFLANRTSLDSRLVDIVEQIKDSFGPLFHLIYVRSDKMGRVIGHFTLLNTQGFQIVLAENGGTPEQAIALVSNPLSPSDWSDEAADLFDIPFEWLASPDYDSTFQTQRKRIADVMNTYTAFSRRKEWHRMADAVFERYGLGENDPVPEHLWTKISNEIGARIAAHTLSMPFEEAVTEDQMRAIFGDSGLNPNES